MNSREKEDQRIRTVQDDDLFVPFDDLKAKHGIAYTRVHLRRLVKAGAFPAPYQLGPNRIAWKLGQLKAWKAARVRCQFEIQLERTSR